MANKRKQITVNTTIVEATPESINALVSMTKYFMAAQAEALKAHKIIPADTIVPTFSMATFEEIAIDFINVAAVAGFPIATSDVEVTFSPAPHTRPKNLPKGKMAVYVFVTDTHCLKVGKAGPKTASRYTYQHYKPGAASSTLAASVVAHAALIDERSPYWSSVAIPCQQTIGDWLLQNVSRANFLINASHSAFLLNLLEGFVQCRLQPVFEG